MSTRTVGVGFPAWQTQFGAVKAANGSVTFTVGFALKNPRQITSQSTVSIAPQTTVGPTVSTPTAPPSKSTTASKLLYLK
ncbi:hypothetical protein GALMADRAFT_133769 [Galerina marginata CBS 339.88]|uniref:Uncharacterized protein n=1 Tax=Galerina marginata (strain CBS 339.88) TaxID=685588 RepID=A0A067TX17_GALM3|nr:hypothetical protein GALMADRAFT_133769 [Galerina marginata CBS 339.88]